MNFHSDQVAFLTTYVDALANSMLREFAEKYHVTLPHTLKHVSEEVLKIVERI